MTERAYTVRELDRLRRIIENKCLFGHYDPNKNSGWSIQHSERDLAKKVEERVRTHMLAGHTAEDLIKSEGESGLRGEEEKSRKG